MGTVASYVCPDDQDDSPPQKKMNTVRSPKGSRSIAKSIVMSRLPPKNNPGGTFNFKIFESIPGMRFTSSFLNMLRYSVKRPNFTKFSIFKKDDSQRKEANDKIEGKVEFSSPAEDRAFGVIFGMAIGDAMGARLEFQPVQYNTITLSDMGNGLGGKFKLQPGQWTDDSSMGFCLADSLIWSKGWKPHDCMQRFLAWWHLGYNNAFGYDDKRSSKHSVGLEGNMSQSFQFYAENREPYTTVGDKNTSGSGSVVRLAAVPIYYRDDINEAIKISYRQSKITHQGVEAGECCCLLTFIIIKCINGEQIKDVLNNLGETFKTDVYSIKCLAMSECEMKIFERRDEDRNWNWKSSDFKYSPTRTRKQPDHIGSYAMDATAMSLHCIWTTESAEDAILKAVNLCGDSDSVGSVTGQLAGAAYGASAFPKDWIKTVQQWDGGNIALRAHYLFNKSYSQ